MILGEVKFCFVIIVYGMVPRIDLQLVKLTIVLLVYLLIVRCKFALETLIYQCNVLYDSGYVHNNGVVNNFLRKWIYIKYVYLLLGFYFGKNLFK